MNNPLTIPELKESVRTFRENKGGLAENPRYVFFRMFEHTRDQTLALHKAVLDVFHNWDDKITCVQDLEDKINKIFLGDKT